MKQNKFISRIKDFVSKKSFNLSLRDSVDGSNPWSSATNFLDAYKISMYVNRALIKRAAKVGEINFEIYKGDKKEEENDILNILNSPNKLFSKQQFWGLYQTYRDIYGEVFIWVDRAATISETKKGKVSELHLINPSEMKPLKDKQTGALIGWEREKKSGSNIKYDLDEIIRDWIPDPASQLTAMPFLQSGVKEISTSIQLSEYQNNILKNGGRIGDLFKIKTDRINKEQLEELKDQYKKNYAEAKKSGTPLFMGGDSDYIRTALTPEELSFLESKKSTLNDICILTEVPKPILASLDDIKFDNADASMTIFMRETIQPLMVQLTSRLNEFLLPDDLTLKFTDPVPENREETRKDLETANTIHAMTINEKRDVLGLDPVKDGDDILVPLGLSPLGAEDFGSPSNETAKGSKKKVKNHPLEDPAVRKVYSKYKVAKEDSREKKLRKELDIYFKEQRDRIINSAIPAENRSITKDVIDEAFNESYEIKIAVEKFKPIMEAFLLASGNESLQFLGFSGKFVLSGEMAGWLDKKVNVFSKEINDTTFKQLKSQFSQSLEAGEGREQLVRRIDNTYSDISKGRARVIARTEVHNANSYGTFQAYDQAGIQSKIWVTVGDGNVRESHSMVDGEKKLMTIPFTNGLMYPGDITAPAGEVINCRCKI